MNSRQRFASSSLSLDGHSPKISRASAARNRNKSACPISNSAYFQTFLLIEYSIFCLMIVIIGFVTVFVVFILLNLSPSSIEGSSPSSSLTLSKLIQESYTTSIEKLGSLTPNLRKVTEGMHVNAPFLELLKFNYNYVNSHDSEEEKACVCDNNYKRRLLWIRWSSCPCIFHH